MRKSMGILLVLAGMMVLLAACGGEKYEPHAINEATDVCAICKMAIKDDQYATQIVTKDGQSLKFDDIGCLNTWKKENGTDNIGAAFVRDYNSKQWLRYEKAYYAYDASYKTPMAYGIVSFEKEADAKAFIDGQGKGTLMTADELASHSWAVNRDMMDMGGMDGHGHSHSEEDGHGGGKSGHSGQEEGHSSGDDHGQAENAGGHAS
ncbi:nitrous oxide reductase accessory protein NosL [Paenibacillus pinihumi]|uniref:nitrous oxide reductase accessory protein NosL n=1 Tax=Paenibacillus pinihumi TaxID=669462 RepID=UPI0006880462|nr:nitrous oxide reductase accessory protein NosL [Paenibacillus pinihumi]